MHGKSVKTEQEVIENTLKVMEQKKNSMKGTSRSNSLFTLHTVQFVLQILQNLLPIAVLNIKWDESQGGLLIDL